jgi:hypothetical protein
MADLHEKQREHVARMIERDAGLVKTRKRYEQMARLQYSLPEPLNSFEWVHPIISSSPYDALRGGTRALSNQQEDVNIDPVTILMALNGKNIESKAAKRLANEWETILDWQMGRMKQRNPSLRSSIVWSSLLYHEIVGQLIHLPTQFKAKPLGPVREAAALRYGDWALRIVDPKTVYVDYTDLMPERVASVTTKTARELVDFWGDAAKKIGKKAEGDDGAWDDKYLEVDYSDYDSRTVWVIEGENLNEIEDVPGITIRKPEPWLSWEGKSVPFLPWIAVAGGTGIDAAPEHQRRPMLYPVLMAEQWATTNVFGTMLMSLATAEAAAPTNVFAGVGAENVEIDYTQAGGRVDLPSQFLKYERIQRLGLDPALREALAMVETAIRRSTVAEVLVTGQPMSAEAPFAAYNLQVMQALASLGDYKELAETFLEDVYRKMLLISHYTGHDIVGYKKGKTFTIDSEKINPECIYVDVKLQPDVPVDRMQRYTSAVQMAQSLPYAPQRILEQLGETDPEGALRDWKWWRLDLADFEGWLQKIKMEASGEIQQLVAQMAQQMNAQQQQAQQQQGQVQPQGTTPGLGLQASPAPTPGAPPGMPVEGQGFNPAIGATPPAMAAPGATREMQTGMARGGGEVQGGY